DPMTEELRDTARTLGLDRLTDEHLKQFDRDGAPPAAPTARHADGAGAGACLPGEGGYAMSGELAYLGFAEAAELIRAKKLSPVEYVTALLTRIEHYDANYSAFIALTPERALTAARTAETEIAAGRRRGPFHGMPYALKDIIGVEGLATTAHSKILKGKLARRHRGVRERLEAAGGVLLGKLSTHEFAIGGPSFDLPWPPARNPWSRDHFCGGSRSGGGAGLAAGFFPAALGTDTGGSIRNPASMCGITGMK